jgi:NADPH:quinone reductase-like Zn-dependent oxidoreductase
MKAIRQRGYGAPAAALRMEEVETPEAGEGQVLVRVRAASVNSKDCRIVRASPILIRLLMGVRRPKTVEFGGDAAGVVEAVGSGVGDLKPGDEVFGVRTGACAEYVAGANFVPKPAGLTFEQAAAVPIAGLTALQAVRDKAGVRAGQTVLVNGAGGGVGHLALQIAKAMGAEVTAVTTSDKLDMVRSIGADHVVDYTRTDFTRSGERYDAIIDCGGGHSLGATLRALAPTGKLVIVGAHKRVLTRALMGTLRRRLLKQPISFFVAAVKRDDLFALKDLAEQGKLTPVIDRTYPLAQTADAVAYAETQQARGKVVIAVVA